MMRRFFLFLAACGTLAIMIPVLMASAYAGNPAQHATATLVDESGAVVGFARFVENANGSVVVNVHVHGIAPGDHGIHVHAVGACSPTFASAGGHFNPSGMSHGSHAGDLGNIYANPAGRGNMVSATSQFTISAGTFSILDSDGSSLVIHAGPDDLVTDPAGNSGARIACGVIQGQ
jgi:superoxide dismutase, Cu-Zn family